MSQQRQFQLMGGNNNAGSQVIDTTYTKIFVGGLAWETQRDTMRRYFEQFGEIHEAVVITDKITGRSKGYGFVTFKEPDAAMRACQNPSPVIDGRRANCNLASIGANKNRPPTPLYGTGRFRPAHGLVAPPAYHWPPSTYFQQSSGQYSFPFSSHGYPGYAQDSIYPVNYYSIYGGQQIQPYYTTSGTSGPHNGIYNNLYPFYAHHHQYAQSSQTQGFGVHYSQMLQYPYAYMPQQHYAASGILSLPSPSSQAVATITTTESTITANRVQNAASVAALAGSSVRTTAVDPTAIRTVPEHSSSS